MAGWKDARGMVLRRDASPPFARRLVRYLLAPLMRLLALARLSLRRDERVVLQHIREGRFQRSLALLTGFSAVLGGLEVTLEHYRGSYGQRIMYTPVLLTPALLIASVWAVFSRHVARTLLPAVSLLTMADGVGGFVFHIRGVARKPGGWRIPIVNVIMGPPLFAPLLFGLSGFLGLVAALLRREDDLHPTVRRRNRSLGAIWRAPWLHLVGRGAVKDVIEIERDVAQDVREGRFQKGLALATALLALFNGVEASYSHYKQNFANRAEWLPVLLSPVVMLAGLATLWSRTIARTLLPLSSLAAGLIGTVGFYYHVRGVVRRPDGLRAPVYNLMYGPPVFAPLLFAATGLLGVLASLLRRGN